MVMVPGNRFDRNPRIFVTTFWGDPLAAPKSDPPNLVNSADGDDSPVVLFELSSCDATVLSFWLLCNQKFYFSGEKIDLLSFTEENFLNLLTRDFSKLQLNGKIGNYSFDLNKLFSFLI